MKKKIAPPSVSGSPKIEIKPPRKVRRDARLYELPEFQRRDVAAWLKEQGIEGCCGQIEGHFGIKASRAAVYRALAYWRREERFGSLAAAAQAQLDLEADLGEEDGISAEELQEAVDRSCIARALEIAEETGDFTLYKELRYLSIAALNARTQAKLAEAKIRHDEAKLKQRDREIDLQTKKLALARTAKKAKAETEPDGLISDEQFLAETGMTKAEAIAATRKEFFADVDAVEAAGLVVLPPQNTP